MSDVIDLDHPPATNLPVAKTPNTIIEGEIAQSVRMTLLKDEKVWASRGSLVSLDHGVKWKLEVPGGASAAIGRAFAGEGLSLTRIWAEKKGCEVVLGAGQPGKIAAWPLDRGAILCTRGSFLAARGDVDIRATVAKRAGAALFGGAGLILQKVSGKGVAFVHGAGDFVARDLKRGESIEVSTGNLAAFQESVDYSIVSVAGCRNMLFGGEGLFMAKLTGPGIVYIQTLRRAPAARGNA